jgi:hypothetical protein
MFVVSSAPKQKTCFHTDRARQQESKKDTNTSTPCHSTPIFTFFLLFSSLFMPISSDALSLAKTRYYEKDSQINDQHQQQIKSHHNKYEFDLERDHALPTSAPNADILKSNNNPTYPNPNRHHNHNHRHQNATPSPQGKRPSVTWILLFFLLAPSPR